MQRVQVPDRGTHEYNWWRMGAEAEAAARWDDIHPDDREAIELVEAMAQSRQHQAIPHTRVELLRDALWIFMAGMNPLQRARLVWRLLR